jgi:hypothetical protein
MRSQLVIVIFRITSNAMPGILLFNRLLRGTFCYWGLLLEVIQLFALHSRVVGRKQFVHGQARCRGNLHPLSGRGNYLLVAIASEKHLEPPLWPPMWRQLVLLQSFSFPNKFKTSFWLFANTFVSWPPFRHQYMIFFGIIESGVGRPSATFSAATALVSRD